jgi:hypothetical protein
MSSPPPGSQKLSRALAFVVSGVGIYYTPLHFAHLFKLERWKK